MSQLTALKQTKNWVQRVQTLASFAYGYCLMWYLRLRYYRFLQEARPLAMHLEKEVLPDLRREGVRWLDLSVARGDGPPALAGRSGNHQYTFTGSELLVAFFEELPLTEIRLDTQLEFGQMLEAMLMFLHSHRGFKRATPKPGEYSGWKRGLMAAHMLGPTGYHKFCALMRFDPDDARYEVEYHYCELLWSRVVKNYVEGRSRYGDHRALFQAAPRIAAVAFVVFLLPLLFQIWSPSAAKAATVMAALLGAAGFGLYTHVLGTFLYTREHHDMLIQNYFEQVRKLSRFPETNPDPVFELTPDGAAVYINPAARQLLESLGLDEKAFSTLLPEDYLRLVARALEEPDTPLSMEVVRHGRTLDYKMAAFPGQRSVVLSGRDITYLKTIEAELRERNADIQMKNDELEQAYALVDQELEIVGGIQRTLLPEELPHIPGLDLAVYYETSLRAGGDYYDFFPLADGRWGILIADVSGHGAPAAVLMAITQSIAHIYHDQGATAPPRKLLEYLNETLCRRYTRYSSHFVTAFYAIYDPARHSIQYACAGHNPPRLCREGKISGLDEGRGLPLGVTPEAPYRDIETKLAPGDLLLYYTDGITEAMNGAGELMGLDRLDASLETFQGTAQETLSAILDGLRAFTGAHPPNDDRTLLVLRL